MPVIDDIKEQAQKVKGKSFKYRFEYFWEYYKFYVLGAIVAVIAIVSLVRTIVNAKDTAFEAIFVNASAVPDSTEVGEYLGIDLENYEVYLDYSYQLTTDDSYSQYSYSSTQKLAAVVASREGDVFICNPDIFDRYRSTLAGDLRNYFSDAELEALGDRVIWAAIEDTDVDGTTTVSDPMPLAIDISDAPGIVNNSCYTNDKPVYFCIIANTEHPELCIQFYNYLYE